jgi:hypothetical protein
MTPRVQSTQISPSGPNQPLRPRPTPDGSQSEAAQYSRAPRGGLPAKLLQHPPRSRALLAGNTPRWKPGLLNVPSLSVQDSIIVQGDRETLARETLSNLYKATTGAAPHITAACQLIRSWLVAPMLIQHGITTATATGNTTGHPLARSCC